MAFSEYEMRLFQVGFWVIVLELLILPDLLKPPGPKPVQAQVNQVQVQTEVRR